MAATNPILSVLVMALLCLTTAAQTAMTELRTPFERDSTKTVAWQDCISYYTKLDSAFEEIVMFEAGTTDVGKPLHLVSVSSQAIRSPQDVGNRSVLLVMNNIHPGEPEGADAAMMLARDLVLDPALAGLMRNVVVLIIPMYNVDGALNRGMTRVNQNGPAEHGFRGNARNLDLNRDFMKADALNTRSFIELYHKWKPHVFIDNHTTDGADYQPVMTLISTQRDKLHPVLSAYLYDELEPFLYAAMNGEGMPGMCPYVDVWGQAIPDSGLVAFLETPRYSTGFTTLFNTIGFVAEAHMLKPFPQRVQATYQLMLALVRKMSSDSEQLRRQKKEADEAVAGQDLFALNWVVDSSFRWIDFRGFSASFRTSELTGKKIPVYDRNEPYTKAIRYYDRYNGVNIIQKPGGYLMPQAWREAIALLELNGVPMQRLASDTMIEVEVYYIDSYETVESPYEGHYLHYGTAVRRDTHDIRFHAGDYLVPLGHSSDRFVIEALEPVALDSWFNWNFFDEILQQKEWFSPWLFDSTAARMAQADPMLQQEFEEWLLRNPGAAGNEWARLSFFHQRSAFYESSVRRYPVMRLLTGT
jgi:hypothetical protein